MKRPGSNRKRYILLVMMGLLVLGGVVSYEIGYDKILRKISSVGRSVMTDKSQGEPELPVIDTAALSDAQQKIVTLTRQEFTDQSPGVKFSQGEHQAWCANFVSWIMNEASVPLKNPHSDNWRIPGTFTLHDYYVAEGRFRAVDSGYEPRVGDVAIYRGSPIFGDHVNIVLKNENGMLTTVGGNENNRIRVYENTQKQYKGLLGYGILP